MEILREGKKLTKEREMEVLLAFQQEHTGNCTGNAPKEQAGSRKPTEMRGKQAAPELMISGNSIEISTVVC